MSEEYNQYIIYVHISGINIDRSDEYVNNNLKKGNLPKNSKIFFVNPRISHVEHEVTQVRTNKCSDESHKR